MLLDLIFTGVFCWALFKIGGCPVINGKFVVIGLMLWLIGYAEGSRKWKD